MPPILKIEKTVVFTASDGTVFKDEPAAREYEAKIVFLGKFMSLVDDMENEEGIKLTADELVKGAMTELANRLLTQLSDFEELLAAAKMLLQEMGNIQAEETTPAAPEVKKRKPRTPKVKPEEKPAEVLQTAKTVEAVEELQSPSENLPAAPAAPPPPPLWDEEPAAPVGKPAPPVWE